MRTSRILEKLRHDEPVLLPLLNLTDPSVYELTSLLGFDGIWMDLEHHSTNEETAAGLMRAARVGVADILARPAKGEFMRMARMLEAGAQGIMYPRCDDAKEAREVVRWAKFSPLGERGVDGGNADMPYCTMSLDQYVRKANEQTFLVVQLEQQHAVDNAHQIAEVDGIDVLFLGPGDFSVLSGNPGQTNHKSFHEAMRQVAKAARDAGKHWGCPSKSPQQTRELLDLGARFICHHSDIVMIKNALQQIQRDFAPLGFTFDNQLDLE